MNNEAIEQKNGKKRKKGFYLKLLIITVSLIVLIPVFLYISFFIVMTWETNYSSFNEERTEMMEEIFNITVTDDVKLLHYEDSTVLTKINRCLTLEVEDYEQFIHNNIKSDIESYTPYSREDIYVDSLYYKYVNRRIYIEIPPPTKKGKYIINLNIRE